MYICERCGDLQEEMPVTRYYDKVDGNHWASGYITEPEECYCGGNYVEAKRCPICGDYIPETQEICEICLRENANIDNAILCGKEDTCELQINGYFATIYTEEEINDILEKYARENETKGVSARDYCLNSGWYPDCLRSK